MAEIHLLPLRLDTDGAIQLTAMLSGALAEGIDLGPRGSHIRALGVSLETLLAKLRAEIARNFMPASTDTPEMRLARTALDQLVRDVETLIARAYAYPV